MMRGVEVGRMLGLGLFVCVLSVSAQETNLAETTNQIRLVDVVRQTLSLDPSIQIQQYRIEASRGQAMAASGAFDLRLISSLSRGVEHQRVSAFNFRRQRVDRTILSAGVSKLLRAGIEVSPQIQVVQVEPGGPLGVENNSEVSFNVRIPLARGFGPKVTTADERAAKRQLDAVRQAFRHVIASEVGNTVAAYWNYLFAFRRLEILTSTEQRAKELLEKSEALVQANEVPAAELQQLRANLADKTSSRIAGQQALVEAQHQLGIAAGLPAEQIPALAPPGDDFPAADEERLSAELDSRRWIPQALTSRADLASARLDLDSQEILLQAARNRLKPQIDLNLHAGYAGVNAGSRARDYLSSLGENIEGANVRAGLSFDFSPANRVARGIYLQQEAAVKQAEIQLSDLGRNIESSVLVAMERLRRTVQELNTSDQAVTEYRTAVENEKTKRQLGLSTFLNVLQLEDRLTGALLVKLNAQAEYASGLAQFRFLTGTLVAGAGPNETITLEQLTTVDSTNR